MLPEPLWEDISSSCERMKPEHQGGKEGVIQVKMKICSE
jgi:hypothetical protein